MKVGAKFNQAQWNTIYKDNQLNQVAEFINRNKNYLIYPFELRLGAIRATNTGYKPANNFADSFTSVSQIFDGKSSPLAKWEGAYVVDQPEELLGDSELKLPVGNTANADIHKKSGSARKGYKVGRFVEVMFESERLGTSFTPTPDNTYVQQKYAKTYTMFSTEELSTDDYLKLWIIPDLLPNKFSNEKAPANMADPQFLYIVNNEIYRDPNTGKFAYSRITFASVQDQIATTGQAQWQFIQLAAPGSGYAFPRVHLTADGGYVRDENGRPIVELNATYARNVGVRFMSIEANAPIGTSTIFAVGRPKPVENRSEAPYQDWDQEQYEWVYDEEGFVELETIDGETRPKKKMLGVYKKVQHNQDIWPSRHLFMWKLGAPILDYLTTRTSPTSELAFIDNVSISLSKWGSWKNYFQAKYDPATKWNFGGGVDIDLSKSFKGEKAAKELKDDTIYAPKLNATDPDKTMVVYDFQARVNIESDHVDSDYDPRQLGYTNVMLPEVSEEPIGDHNPLAIANLPEIESGYADTKGARVPDVFAFNAFALANAIELPIDKNSFLTMNYSSLPGISRLLNLLYFIPGVGQIAGVIGGAANDIVSGINPGWRIAGAPYQVSPMLKNFNFFTPFKTADLLSFKDTNESATWLPLNMFDDNSPQNINNLFNFKSVSVQWMGQLSDRLQASFYTADDNNTSQDNKQVSTMALGQTLDNGDNYCLFTPNKTEQVEIVMPNDAVYNLGLVLPPEQINLNDGNGTADQSYIIDYIMIKALGQCDYRIKFYSDDPNQPYADADELSVWVGTYASASKFYTQPTLWTTQIRVGFEEQTDLMAPQNWPQAILPTIPVAAVSDVVIENEGLKFSTDFLNKTEEPPAQRVNLTQLFSITDPLGGGTIRPIETIEDARRYFSDINFEISNDRVGVNAINSNEGSSYAQRVGHFNLRMPSKNITNPVRDLTTQNYDTFSFTGKNPTTLPWPSELNTNIALTTTNEVRWPNEYPMPFIMGRFADHTTTIQEIRNKGRLFMTSNTFRNENDTGSKRNAAGQLGTLRFGQINADIVEQYNFCGTDTTFGNNKPSAYMDVHFYLTSEGGDVYLNVQFKLNHVKWNSIQGVPTSLTWMWASRWMAGGRARTFLGFSEAKGNVLQESPARTIPSGDLSTQTIVQDTALLVPNNGSVRSNYRDGDMGLFIDLWARVDDLDTKWENRKTAQDAWTEVSNGKWFSEFHWEFDYKITLVANK